MIKQCKLWLSESALPVWFGQNSESKMYNFAESLSFENAEPMWDVPQRSMVHCRQIYVLHQAMQLGLLDELSTKTRIKNNTERFIRYNFNEDGSAYHSLNSAGIAIEQTPDLYGQAFALFGLAQGYSLFGEVKYKDKALKLVEYLKKNRSIAKGGFTEITPGGETLYASNPHMHLFESAIEWMKVDSDKIWLDLGKQLLDLCLNHFLDSETGLIGEDFNHNWEHQRTNGQFMFEPGHQYEWAWLMGEYHKITKQKSLELRYKIFKNMEQKGRSQKTGFVFDEVLSSYIPQKTSSRFWPQCERIKLALQLSKELSGEDKELCLKAADEAMKVLFQFLDTPIKGLWYDTLLANGEMKVQPAKASSFYHIVGAFFEYLRCRA